jgi:hypothetical protein
MLPVLLMLFSSTIQSQPETRPSQHRDLLQLFSEWRTFERPPLLNGAPDYTTETFAKRHCDYLRLRQRLVKMDIKRRNSQVDGSDFVTFVRGEAWDSSLVGINDPGGGLLWMYS